MSDETKAATASDTGASAIDELAINTIRTLAMDAVQAYTKDPLKAPVEQFIITGGSKRGWTSWLTAATRDKRVKAIAPMVIDVLNMKAQMENQVKSLGKPSAMIHDYTERGLVPLPDTATARWRSRPSIVG